MNESKNHEHLAAGVVDGEQNELSPKALEEWLTFVSDVLPRMLEKLPENKSLYLSEDPKNIIKALKALISYSQRKPEFDAFKKDIARAQSPRIDPKTFRNHFKSLIDWQRKTEIGLVSFIAENDAKNESHWELPIVKILNEFNWKSFEKLSGSSSEENEVEFTSQLNEAVSKILELPSATIETNNVSEKRKEATINKHREIHSKKLSEEAKIRKNIESFRSSEKVNQQLLHSIVRSVVSFHKRFGSKRNPSNMTIDDESKEIEKEIYQRVIELKLVYDKASEETQKHIKKQFQLYVKILAVNIEKE